MSCSNESLLRLISLTAQVMRSYADHKLKKYDMTVEQLQVLKHIAVDHGHSQKELCEVTGKSAANLTRILDRLENKSYISRKQSSEDRRTTLVFITQQGMDIKDEVLSLFDQMGDALLSEIDLGKQRVAFEVLQLIKNKIETSPNFS